MLYQVRQTVLMGFGGVASLPKVNFKYSEAWCYITTSFDAIRPSFLCHRQGQITLKKNLFRQVLYFLCFDYFLIMVPVRVLVLGHSFIHHLHTFLLRNLDAQIATSLSLPGDLIRWHGIGGRTVFKTISFDLHVVEEFAPNIVILQLGTNDLANTSAVETGSAIEDLSQLLHGSYDVQVVCVCQTIYRQNSPSFNRQVDLLTRYLRVVLEPLPYTIYWRHTGFWRCKSRFLARDGVHLNSRGNYNFFRSVRGAVLRCMRIFIAR